MLKFYTFLIALILSSTIINCQEIQVSIDLDNKIFVIDKELETKLQMYEDIPEFKEARLFKLSDTLFVLEISYEVDGNIARQRKNLTYQEATELRTKITEKLNSKVPNALLNHDGRIRMLVWNVIQGLTEYGWMVPIGFDVQDGKSAIALYMLTTAGSFIVPYYLTENNSVTDAEATLNIFGGFAGAAHGALLYNPCRR